MMTDQLSDKPCVIIYAVPHQDYEQKIREVKAGMEEEGISYSIVQSKNVTAVEMAYQGACESKLGVGIGMSAEALCIHYAKLPCDQPLFILNSPGHALEWRCFGYNAARLVKGIPFKNILEEQSVSQPSDMNELYNLVRCIVAKILQESAPDHGEV
jgi:hypothetical protein